MRIIRLTLKNIRSYTDEEIEFPDGSLLLSGDIGSGKSTILLAIEFALFGLIRGINDGQALLRNGAQKGEVTLSIAVQDRELIITRTLARTKTSVKQDKCYLMADGQTEELIPSQLRSRILELIGYPEMHKAKSLIYRYTVFTSQEEMKAIITDDAAQRLDTLRTLFGIDRYKTITDNCSTVQRWIRKQESYYAGKCSDLAQVRDLYQKLRSDKKNIHHHLEKIRIQEQAAAKDCISSKKHLDQIEKEKEHVNELLRRKASIKSTIDEQNRIMERLILKEKELLPKLDTPPEQREKPEAQEIKDTEARLQQLQESIHTHMLRSQKITQEIEHHTKLLSSMTEHPKETVDPKKIKDKIAITKQAYVKLQSDLEEREKQEALLRQIETELALRRQEYEHIAMPTIMESETCPTCMQPITLDHKRSIAAECAQKKRKIKNTIEALDKRRISLQQTLETTAALPEQRQEQLAAITTLENEFLHATQQEKRNKEIDRQIEETRKHLENAKHAEQEIRKTDPEQMRRQLEDLRKKQEQFNLQKEQYRAYEAALRSYKEAQKQLEDCREELDGVRKEHAEKQDALQEIQKAIGNTDDLRERLEDARKKHDKTAEALNAIRVTRAQQETAEQNLMARLKEQEMILKDRTAAQQHARKFQQVHDWLKGAFLPLMENIEHHVFLSIYQEFNELFIRWFSLLIEDETLVARLDLDFAPVVEQNGYETDVANLSGGERTCVALAYRLALNKVVNDLIQTIHTRNILILDEPTEGFSTEQLDRVKEVLDQIDISQLIIVSHETKVESFVDTVLRIRKDNHRSHVIPA
ncbi:MAG: AAA family ATPase [Nanoarchaeota archaeon]